MWQAVLRDHVDVVELCIECGATDFDKAMAFCAIYPRGRVSMIKLFRDWIGFEAVHQELFRHHHKRRFAQRIHEELLPIAWHPDRFLDWCLDEEEKGFLKGVWRII